MVRRETLLQTILAATVTVSACGSSGGGGSTPTTPTPPAPQANRSPLINNLTFSPTFGIARLTQFQYGAAASDPDGDSVTYSWSLAGNPTSNPSGAVTFVNGFEGSATLTVTDGKGGTTSDSRAFVVGSMEGMWVGTFDRFPITMQLTQPLGGAVSGTFAVPGTTPGTIGTGQLDPAANNRIEASGHVVLRLKLTAGTVPVNDFTFDGTMDQTGHRVTGSVSGSGFTGQPFSLTKP
jgi:hypothetical protein